VWQMDSWVEKSWVKKQKKKRRYFVSNGEAVGRIWVSPTRSLVRLVQIILVGY
jgi:hypothetical protein